MGLLLCLRVYSASTVENFLFVNRTARCNRVGKAGSTLAEKIRPIGGLDANERTMRASREALGCKASVNASSGRSQPADSRWGMVLGNTQAQKAAPASHPIPSVAKNHSCGFQSIFRVYPSGIPAQNISLLEYGRSEVGALLKGSARFKPGWLAGQRIRLTSLGLVQVSAHSYCG